MDRKALVRQYLKVPRPAGVYRVVNTRTGKLLLGSSSDLAGMLNRQRFQLENGLHPDKEIQADWNELGSGDFAFEMLDVLKPSDEPNYDPLEDLRALEEMWLEKLTSSGALLYLRSRRGT